MYLYARWIGNGINLASFFLQVISCLIDPLLQMCTMSASHLSTCDMAAYMINCIYQMQTTLAVYEFTDKHIEMLAAQVRVILCYTYLNILIFVEVSTRVYLTIVDRVDGFETRWKFNRTHYLSWTFVYASLCTLIVTCLLYFWSSRP